MIQSVSSMAWYDKQVSVSDHVPGNHTYNLEIMNDTNTEQNLMWGLMSMSTRWIWLITALSIQPWLILFMIAIYVYNQV